MSPEERRNMRRQQIEQFLASDMNVGEWTALNHMSQSTFYLWLRKFQREEPGSFGGESTERGGWIELSRSELRGSVALAKREEGKVPEPPAKPTASLPAQGQPGKPAACVRIALNGASVEVPAGVSEADLAVILRAVASL